MAKKLTCRGTRTVLPIIGDTLVELRLFSDRWPAFVFGSQDDTESEIRIEDRLALARGDCELLVLKSILVPATLAPLLELVGCKVAEAIAERDGRLRLDFTNGLTLTVTPTTGFEAWHFQYPRPGCAAGGNLDRLVSVTGAFGHLI